MSDLTELRVKLQEFAEYALEHGHTLKNHKAFGEMYRELHQAIDRHEAAALPETARRRHCLTCKHEPDWQSRHGRCKLALAMFGETGAVVLERFDLPDEVYMDVGEVYTVAGEHIKNCTGWEPKEPES